MPAEKPQPSRSYQETLGRKYDDNISIQLLHKRKYYEKVG